MSAILKFPSSRFFDPCSADARIVVAVSSCLAGAPVRYDGASKELALLRDWSDAGVELRAICPELGAGLGVPRPPVQLIAADGSVRARGRDDATLDVTNALEDFAQRSVTELQREPALCGYVWKSRSPSCGLTSTPLFDAAGTALGVGRGLQARAISAALPWLVHIEDSVLPAPLVAARFLLQCRLIFDLRRAIAADPAVLPAWHRHFLSLWEHAGFAPSLAEYSARDDWKSYAVQLNRACENTEAEQLLGLFVQ